MFFKVLNQAVLPFKYLMFRISTQAQAKLSINREPRQQFMKITQSAKQRITKLMNQKNDPLLIGLKIGLIKKGCNGLTYSMNYISQQSFKKFDQVVDLDNGIKIVIDSKAIMAIIGTQLDFIQNQIGSEFVFRNPNQKGRCGCGQSFHL